MKHIVICGTSGAGKTYLEEYLDSNNICFWLPKYFDRPYRPNERRDKNISLTREEWLKIKDEFFFTLFYNNHNYGWKREDIKKDKMVVLAITLDSIDDFMRKNKNFLPILLWVDKKNIGLLSERLKRRGDSEDEIKKRIELAKKEIEKGDEYKIIVKNYGGWIINIENDETIFRELIPKISHLGNV